LQIFKGGDWGWDFWTSPSAGLVVYGDQAIGGPCPGRAVVSTWDGGRRWFSVGSEIGFSDRGSVRVGECTFSTVAGRGKLLFHHDFGDTLFRVEGWPPEGDVHCQPVETSWALEVCAAPPDNAGIRSVPATRLTEGRFGGDLRPVPGGVVALIFEGPLSDLRVNEVAFFRYGSFSSVPLPSPSTASGWMPSTGQVHIAWPIVYVLSLEPEGLVLWRSTDGGGTWTVRLGAGVRASPARLSRKARTSGRALLPGGSVTSVRDGRRLLLRIRQLDRTRVLALPGASKCSALQPRVTDWPNISIEGLRAGSVRAVWWSTYGGYGGWSWRRFGHC
jgi:hypothetical protein